MATKFYLHLTTQTSTGTLPASNVSISATSPSQIGDSGTNRTADLVKGASQIAASITTAANTNAQPSVISRFVSNPLSAQTIGSQQINISLGGSESNAQSNFQVTYAVALWRPSSGTKVGLLTDLPASSLEPGTSETSLTATVASSTSQTAADGDVLVFEIWRDSTVQGNATARTNSIFYDGTTEASTSSNAAFVNLNTSTLKFLGAGKGQAQADIKATSQGFGQARAYLPNSFGAQAQALISGTSTSVVDTFTRSVTDDWGTADTGGAYTFVSGTAANFDVNGSQGTIVFSTSTQKQVLKTASLAVGVSVKFTASASAVPTGANIGVFIGIGEGAPDLSSITLSKYQLGLQFQTTGNTIAQAGYNGTALSSTQQSYSAGDTHQVYVQLLPASNGKVLARGKTWKVGTAEPAWTEAEVTTKILVPGYVALYASSGALLSNTPTITIDDLTVESAGITYFGQAQADIKATSRGYGQAQAKIVPTRAYGQANALITQNGDTFVLDNFVRTVSNGWGTAGVGGDWTIFTGTAADFSVSSSEGIIANANSGSTHAIFLNSFLPNAIITAREYESSLVFKFSALPSVGTVSAYVVELLGSSENTAASNIQAGIFAEIDLTSAGNLSARASVISTGSSTSTVSYTPGDYYRIKWRILSTNTETTVWIRLWKDGDTEPGDWGATVTSGSTVLFGHAGLIVSGSGGTAVTLTVDQLNIYNASLVASAQAQAKIATTRVYGQAQTDIKAASRGYGQAQAQISTLVTFYDNDNSTALIGNGIDNSVASASLSTQNGPTTRTFPSKTTAPLQATTISGPINMFLYMREDNLAANAASYIKIEKLSSGVLSTIIESNSGVELTTSNAYQTWSTTPGSPVTINLGDKLKFTVGITDAGGTMASGFNAFFAWGDDYPNGPSDVSYVIFNDEIHTAGIYMAQAQATMVKFAKQTGFAQAQAQITVVRRMAIATAVVAGLTTASDEFGRSTSNGWGTADVGGNWVIVTGTASDFSTSGTVGQIGGTSSHIINLPSVGVGGNSQYLVKVKVPSLPTVSNNNYCIAFFTYSNVRYAIAGLNIFSDASWGLTVGSNNTQGFSASGTNFDTTKYYWIRIAVWAGKHQISNYLGGNNLQDAQNVAIKIWQDGTTEPGWDWDGTTSNDTQQLTNSVVYLTPGYIFGPPGIFINQPTDNYTISFDSFSVSQFNGPTFQGQAQADIKATYRGSAQAQADIKQTYPIGTRGRQSQTLATGQDSIHKTILVNGMLFSSLRTDPAKLIRWRNPGDLSTYDVITFAADGRHANADYLVYSPDTNRVYVSFRSSKPGGGFGPPYNTVVASVNPDTFTVVNANFIDDQVSTTDQASASPLTVDSTYLYIALQTHTDDSQIRKYALSDGSYIGNRVITGFPVIHTSEIDVANSKIYVAGPNGASSWVGWVTTDLSSHDTLVLGSSNLPGSNSTLQGNYYWLAIEGGTAGRILRIKKDLSTTDTISTGLSVVTYGVYYDGTSIWTTVATTPGAVLRIDPTTFNVLETINLQSGEDVSDHVLRLGSSLYVVCFLQPSKIVSVSIESDQAAYAQAQATITAAAITAGYGQAQADIKVTSQGYAQAQADIKVTTNAFAQAQADIKVTTNVFAQAQADIKATNQGYAQAQADINATSFGFAQAQADIKATSFGEAQAQADIKVTSTGFGQAQADIKATSNAFSQAQADINATSQGYAQAQADVKATTNVFAQAQADIKATSNSFAQAQADIKQTYNGCAQAQACIVGWGFGQAQADIKQTYQVFAQAQADIKQTYVGCAQAQADIKATSNGYGQAQGTVITTYQGYAQAQADIKATSNGFGQAQADVKATSNGFAQAQSDIKATSNGFAQANADIKAVSTNYSNPYAQAQADIKATNQGYGQAQADINQTYNGFGQAQSDIKATYQGYANAQADIKAIYQGYAQSQADINATSDGFAQSQADIKAVNDGFGQAQADIKTTYQGYGQAQADIDTNYQGYGQAQSDIKVISYGWAQAQADINAASDGFGQANADIKAVNDGFGQAQAKINAFGVNAFAQAQGNVLFAGTQGHAQAQAKINAFGQCVFSQAQADIKATGQGYGQANADILATSNVFAQSQADIKVTSNGFAQAQADIDATSDGFGQAQSDIKQTYQGYGQSQADIKAVGYGFGQAQSDILTSYQAFAQAQADIKQTYQGYSQAQADIKATSNGFGQANADIKATSDGFGQSQADIKQTYQGYAQAQADIDAISQGYGQAQAKISINQQNVCAQAQADIKVTSQGYGQSQADIKATSQGYGQTQATILAGTFGWGQANCDIKATTNTCAQAQADIKVTTVNCAQANCLIVVINQKYGQAQGDIKATSNGYGQAQGDIKQTYNGFGQAQADTKVTTTVCAQANCLIVTTNQSYAQAQADIKVTTSNCAQAQADIKVTTNKCAQAQADIKVTTNAYGQSQAYIKLVQFGFAQAQATIRGNAFSQAQADIKTTNNVSACAQGWIKTTINTIGQSQALIRRTEQGYAQAQAQIKTQTNSPAQAQALIVLLGQAGYAQAQALLIKAAGYAQAAAYVITGHTLKRLVGTDSTSLLVVGLDRVVPIGSITDTSVTLVGTDRTSLVVIGVDRKDLTLIGQDESY